MFIQESELFKGLRQDIVDEIAESMIEELYGEGEFIIKEGDPTDSFYILQEGQIRLRVGEKAQITHMVSNSGEAFGWSSLVDRDTYTASAECVAPSKLMRIEKEKLNKVFERDPASGLVFFKRLAGIIGHRLVSSYHKLLAAYKEEGPPSYG